MGVAETNLLDASGRLLERIDTIVSYCRTHSIQRAAQIPDEVLGNVDRLIAVYLRAFKLWCIPDSNKLSSRLTFSLGALRNALAVAPIDHPRREEMITNIARLKAQLLRIGGQTRVDQFERDYDAGLYTDAPVGTSNNPVSTPTPPSDNLCLVHETLIDPSFRYTPDTANYNDHDPVLEARRREYSRRYWLSVESDLCGAGIVRAHQVVEDIAATFQLFPALAPNETPNQTPNQTPNEQEPPQAPPTVSVRQAWATLVAENFEWDPLFALFDTLAAHFRCRLTVAQQAEFNARWGGLHEGLRAAADTPQHNPSRAISATFKFMFDASNALHAERRNTELTRVRPTILRHGIDYERAAFERDFLNGTVNLLSTVNWLQAAAADDNNLADNLLAGDGATFPRFMARAYASLLSVSDTPLPDTLRCDITRMTILRSLHNSIVTSIIATTAVTNEPTVADAIALQIRNSWPSVQLTLDDIEMPSLLRTELQLLLAPTSAARAMHTRTLSAGLEACLLETLVDGSPPPQQTLFIGSDGALISAHLTDLFRLFSNIAHVNYRVFSAKYLALIPQIITDRNNTQAILA